MKPQGRARLRFVAWACLLVVVLAAASPAGGPDPAFLPPAGPIVSAPAAISVLRDTGGLARPDLVVLRGIAARAPPLA